MVSTTTKRLSPDARDGFHLCLLEDSPKGLNSGCVGRDVYGGLVCAVSPPETEIELHIREIGVAHRKRACRRSGWFKKQDGGSAVRWK
ncbi:hypothetical protein Ae201684P_018114 [Aphanomyces euteiches]|uniref:Uncharacterized protein n=1 Tax=Aphanomyces euteiches TaxID=100861 RepID=A0A6G0X3E1_9STRA|nr:hypothetical protein Ae201684_008897 [Aphanomyces euteiches]KAH9054393.1 hypothetical protein Ae201684P_018114 [Aphanomyces euteiches]